MKTSPRLVRSFISSQVVGFDFADEWQKWVRELPQAVRGLLHRSTKHHQEGKFDLGQVSKSILLGQFHKSFVAKSQWCVSGCGCQWLSWIWSCSKITRRLRVFNGVEVALAFGQFIDFFTCFRENARIFLVLVGLWGQSSFSGNSNVFNSIMFSLISILP